MLWWRDLNTVTDTDSYQGWHFTRVKQVSPRSKLKTMCDLQIHFIDISVREIELWDSKLVSKYFTVCRASASPMFISECNPLQHFPCSCLQQSQVLLPFPSQTDIVVCFAPHRSRSITAKIDGRWSSLSAVILRGGNTAFAVWHRYPPQIRWHKITLTVNLKITGLLFWHNLFIYLFEKKLFIYLRMLNAMKKNMMHHIVYCSQDQKSRNLLYMLYPVLPT